MTSTAKCFADLNWETMLSSLIRNDSVSINLLTVELIYSKLEDEMPFCRVVLRGLFCLVCVLVFFFSFPAIVKAHVDKKQPLQRLRRIIICCFSFLVFLFPMLNTIQILEVGLLLMCQINFLK